MSAPEAPDGGLSGARARWSPAYPEGATPQLDSSLPGLDLLPLCVTFLLCFWEVQYGILAGTLVSALILLHSVARPKMQVPARLFSPSQGSAGLRGPGGVTRALGGTPWLNCHTPLRCDSGPWHHPVTVHTADGCQPPAVDHRALPLHVRLRVGVRARQLCSPRSVLSAWVGASCWRGHPLGTARSDLPVGPTGCPLLCPQLSEGPVLVLQPASGLHFPAIESLREAILSRTLEGAWAGAPRLPATFSVPPSAPAGP